MLIRRHNCAALDAAVARLWAAGLNSYEIAQRLGVAEALVADILHALREQAYAAKTARAAS